MPAHVSRRRMLQWSVASLASLQARALPGAEEGYTPLFNGHDLSGWEGDTLLWVVEDGMLIGRSPGIRYNDFLATRKSYSDFILRLNIQLVNGTGNSGVQFRSRRMTGAMEMIGYQADIGPRWWGNLYDESRRRRSLVEADKNLIQRVVKPDGWNDYEIHAQGNHIRLTLNGETTADYVERDPNIEQDGLIALQIHSGPPLEVRFKNIRIKGL